MTLKQEQEKYKLLNLLVFILAFICIYLYAHLPVSQVVGWALFVIVMMNLAFLFQTVRWDYQNHKPGPYWKDMVAIKFFNSGLITTAFGVLCGIIYWFFR